VYVQLPLKAFTNGTESRTVGIRITTKAVLLRPVAAHLVARPARLELRQLSEHTYYPGTQRLIGMMSTLELEFFVTFGV
jgi:hypothetical protein